MIDYLAIRIPEGAPPTPFFSDLYASTRSNPKVWKSGQFYSASAKLDEFGVDAIVHMDCRMTKKNMHKVEILRAGDKNFEDLLSIPSRLFHGDPLDFGVMRVDLTADVTDVGMDWFKRHTHVRNKQTRREHGVVDPYETIRKGRAQTLYAGVKPNQFRMYDKTAERQWQYSRYLGKFIRGQKDVREQASYDVRHGLQLEMPEEMGPTTFEALYGTDYNAVVTRVERQVAARDLDRMGLTTVGSLRRLPLLDPFASMIFYDESPGMEPLPDLSSDAYCAGMMWRSRLKEFGLDETLACMKAAHGKNFHRAKKKFDPFLRVTENVVGIDSKQLTSLFRGSVTKQLLNLAA